MRGHWGFLLPKDAKVPKNGWFGGVLLGRITAIVVILFACAPGVILADSPLDFDVSNGYFYSQGVASSSAVSLKGYTVANNDDALMLDGFEKLGGVPTLGYPISRRFLWRDAFTQVTQRAILQWDGDDSKVVVLDVFDELNSMGLDDKLHKDQSIPRRIGPVAADQNQDPDDLANARMALLDDDPVIKDYYESTPYASRLFGLPTSEPEDFGAFVAMRFQRTVLQRWKIATDFAQVDDVTPVNAGQLAKDLGLISGAGGAWDPEDAPTDSGQRLVASSRGDGGATRGVATWYGTDFEGQAMKNGEPYDMNDPTTTACNAYAVGTKLKVTDTDTGKAIVVTVTDIGAFTYPIVVDLSHAAFEQLADPDVGVIQVVVEPLRN